jgi:multisubunit Na+/H+ antiporter MnhB subunit
MRPGGKQVAGILLVFLIGILILGAGSITEPGSVLSFLSFNAALWEYRGFDVLAQAMILIAGALAVVVLLREEPGND